RVFCGETRGPVTPWVRTRQRAGQRRPVAGCIASEPCTRPRNYGRVRDCGKMPNNLYLRGIHALADHGVAAGVPVLPPSASRNALMASGAGRAGRTATLHVARGGVASSLFGELRSSHSVRTVNREVNS